MKGINIYLLINI